MKKTGCIVEYIKDKNEHIKIDSKRLEGLRHDIRLMRNSLKGFVGVYYNSKYDHWMISEVKSSVKEVAGYFGSHAEVCKAAMHDMMIFQIDEYHHKDWSLRSAVEWAE